MSNTIKSALFVAIISALIAAYLDDKGGHHAMVNALEYIAAGSVLGAWFLFMENA